MSIRRRSVPWKAIVRVWIAALAAGAGALGCPQLLEDGFETGLTLGGDDGILQDGSGGSLGRPDAEAPENGDASAATAGDGGSAGSGAAGSAGAAGASGNAGSGGSPPTDGDAGPDAASTCGGEADCGGSCVDPLSDELHCGDCETVCTPGASCEQGQCSCPSPTPFDCGTACQECCNDPDCGSGLRCEAGTCVASCSAPLSTCGLTCKSLTNDAANCGACGYACGIGRSCANSACSPGWIALPAPPAGPAGLVARENAGYTAMGSKVFIFGGENSASISLSTGAVYDPALNSWAMLPAGPLSTRVLPVAVWTGSEVIVWGGGDASGAVDRGDGARYSPLTNTWTAMSSVGAPSARRGAHAFWTGSKMLLWSGLLHDDTVAERAVVYLYDPVADVWSLGGSTGVVPQEDLSSPQVAWSGTSLFIYGGFRDGVERDAFYEYDAVAQQWFQPIDGPTDRNGTLGGWDGGGFVAWGGMNDNNVLPDGKRWVPNATPQRGTWNNTASNALKQRWADQGVAGWSAAIGGGKLLLFGGANTSTPTYVADVLRYDSNTNTWTTLAAWPSGSAHVSGVGVWTGQEMILWSGRPSDAGAVTTQGERYRP